jgi:AcrR family transcriptional regulator
LAADTDDDANAGRPADRGVARRQAFLQAARHVFLEQGYAAASVNDVVRLAGGSLATLYSQFQSKEGLFQAVVTEQHARFVQAMEPECVDHRALEEGLCAIGERFLTALLEPDNLAFFRLVIGEGRHFPEAARRNVSVGSDQVRNVVEAFLRSHGVVIADDETHPSMLLELWRSRYHYRALADDQFRPTPEEIKRHVALGVDFFLRGIAHRRP